MSLFSFSKKMTEDDYSLVLNISSGSVGGALIKFTEKPGVQVINYLKEPIPFQKEISAQTHLELLKTAISSLVAKLQKEKHQNISVKNAFYIFSSPWSISQTKTVRIKEPKAFKLTDRYLNNLLDSQSRELSIAEHGQVIEKKIVQIKVNGYVINQPQNESTKEAEVSLFTSVVPESVLKAVEEAVHKTFHLKNVWYHSTALSIFSVIRDLFPNQEDFTYLDISEEMTDLAIVKNGLVKNQASFPFGRNNFLRSLAKDLNTTEILADSLINMHNDKVTDKAATLRFNSAINKLAGEWVKRVGEILAGPDSSYLKQRIFFVATNDLATLLVGRLESERFEITTLEAKKITSSIKIDDTIFKTGLVFLDKLYKI